MNIKGIYLRNKTVFQNFSYISLLQIFVMLIPLITYPYLIRTLGKELYGWVITAQVVASYCSIFIDFGFKNISAKHISIWRDDKAKLSEIISSIFFVQCIIWILCLFLYISIIILVPSYREHLWLFLFSFGLTFNELLFPQYYFQGIEKMKYITIINIVTRLIFVILIFFVVKSSNDYIYVPLLLSIGYFIGGMIAIYIMFFKHGIKFRIPKYDSLIFYIKDATPIFFTNIICTIKDKLNYLLLGACVGMKEVAVYDLGSKFHGVLTNPVSIVSTVLLPQMARSRNIRMFKKVLFFIFIITLIFTVVINILLPDIVHFFIADTIDLTPIRLYLLSPILLGISGFISSNLMVALGYNRYLLNSIIITTTAYIILLVSFYIAGFLDSVNAFVILTVVSYFVELVYRVIIGRKIIKKEELHSQKKIY